MARKRIERISEEAKKTITPKEALVISPILLIDLFAENNIDIEEGFEKFHRIKSLVANFLKEFNIFVARKEE
jgi:hypothetical protein